MSTTESEKHGHEQHEGSSQRKSSEEVTVPLPAPVEGYDPVTADWTHAYEKKIIHRVDWRLLPILGAMYAISLIDRTNMSSARIAGMDKELKLYIGQRYSITLLVFFIPYFLFELPSNVVLRKVGAARWLSSICLAWGLVMLGMGFVNNWQSLAILRAVMGLFEAGFFPGCVYLISCWYVRYEVQKRLAAFYLVSVFISGFSAILAYGLMLINLNKYAGWRWIFIIEGVITCVIGILAYTLIIDFPDKLPKSKRPFLSLSEVDIIKYRIDRDRKDAAADELTWGKVRKHLSDWKLWCFALLFMCTTMPAYAFGYFLPVILRGAMGYSLKDAQLLSAPPYILAAAFAFTLAIYADKTRMRGPFIVLQAVMAIVGLVLTAYVRNHGARYFGVILGVAGAQGNVPSILAYQSNNIRTDSKRSVGSALQVGFGAIGGIFASTAYRQQDAPTYIPGFWATIGCQFFIIFIVAVMTVYFQKNNDLQEKREKVLEDADGFRYTY